MRQLLAAMLAVTILATGSVGAATRNGDLDPNFGAAGQVLVDIGAGSAVWASMAIAADDGILLVGSYDAGLPTGIDFIVARLHPDGTLDTGFSFDGKVEVAVGPGASEDQVFDILVQPDGKIVLVGTAVSPTVDNGTDMAIVRLNPDGSLDTGFGPAGKVFIDFGLGGAAVNDEARAVAEFADGKLIVAGSTPVSDEGFDMGLVKLNTDGTRDTSFGIGGRAVVRFGLDPVLRGERVATVEVDDQGRVMVAGTTQKGVVDTDFAVARLLGNGALDATFNADGRVTIAFDLAGDLRDIPFGLLVESDGSLTLVGFATDVNVDMAVARLHPDGSPITGFGNDGRVTVPFDLGGEDLDGGTDVVRTAEGNLLIAGLVVGSAPEQYAGLVQLLPSGALDPDFGIVGKALVGNDFGGAASTATVVRLVNGRAIIGGLATDNASQVGLMAAAVLIDVLFANDFEEARSARSMGTGKVDRARTAR